MGTKLVIENSRILVSEGRWTRPLHLYSFSQGTGDLPLKVHNRPKDGEGGQTTTPCTDPHSHLVPPLPPWPHSQDQRHLSQSH